jgi:hypothetical protein
MDNPDRDLPPLTLHDCPKDYAWFLGQGWDTIQEAWSLSPDLGWLNTLKSAKDRAGAQQSDLEGFVEVAVGVETFRVFATGAKGGFAYRLQTDDFIVMVGSAMREWTISVRYLSSGLWQYGWLVLRERVYAALITVCRQTTLDCVRVSRADWAFDFYSPALRDELFDTLLTSVVASPMATDRNLISIEAFGNAVKGRTITIGSRGGCQVQLYDKAKEITEASGKTWFYPLWRAALPFDPWPEGVKVRDVYRIECRFASDFLKERNIRRPFQIEEHLKALLAEALCKRRLTLPLKTTPRRDRWPLHPLWSEAFRAVAADHMAPIGRIVEGRREILLAKMVKQLAGTIRSAGVLAVGANDEETCEELIQQALAVARADPLDQKKAEMAMDRYRNVMKPQ